nr:DUF4390 domain-containing protein [Acidovorax temperans]
MWWAPGAAVFAQQDAGEAQGLRIERAEDGLYLGASFDFTLPDLAEEALHKGIPMFFVMEAQVRRDRWYWSDRVVAEATRYLRLSYQPLTRRWRLSTSSVPFTNSGLGVVLGQNFDELDEALSAMRRVIRWRIGDADVLEPNAAHTVQLRFRLDMSQLPRPLQIGAVGRSDWNLLVFRSQRLPSRAQP